MLIKMQDVGFGEAILLQQNGINFLVDCGSKCKDGGIIASESVLSALENGKNHLLITHFDEDHYNGIIELAGKVKFEKIYLPAYFWKTVKENKREVWNGLCDTIRVWAYKKIAEKSDKLDKIHQLFMVLPELVNSLEDIVYVEAGDAFLCFGELFHVLWPEVNSYHTKRAGGAECGEILNRLYPNQQTMHAIVEQYVSAFEQLYLSYAEETVYGESQNKDVLSLQKGLEDAYKELNEFVQNNHLKLDEAARKRFAYISRCKIRSMNECSVVIHHDDVLLLGDISERIFRKVIRDELYEEYKVIKIAHHGTKPYYMEELPKSKRYLISNSGSKYMHWKICEKYGEKYPEQIMCTNTNKDRCWKLENSKNRCRYCKVGGNGDIELDMGII